MLRFWLDFCLRHLVRSDQQKVGPHPVAKHIHGVEQVALADVAVDVAGDGRVAVT